MHVYVYVHTNAAVGPSPRRRGPVIRMYLNRFIRTTWRIFRRRVPAKTDGTNPTEYVRPGDNSRRETRNNIIIVNPAGGGRIFDNIYFHRDYRRCSRRYFTVPRDNSHAVHFQ